MKVLAFDSCFGAVSAAVRWPTAGGEMIVREVYEERDSGHAERLLGLVDEVLGAAGLAFADIDRIAVTLGPGSFTGLRASIAAARALALAAGKPVVGLSSLEAMAERASLLLGIRRESRKLAVAVDARRGANYVQIFGENIGEPLSPPQLLTAAEAAAMLPAGAVVLVGSGGPAIASAAGRADVEAVLPDLQPHARQLAMLAPFLPVLDRVTPMYLRAADAKPSTAPSLSRRIGP